MPPLISGVQPSLYYPFTFFHSKYLTLEGAQKVLGELGIKNVRLAKSGAFYVSGEYIKYGGKLYKQEYITILRKEAKICER